MHFVFFYKTKPKVSKTSKHNDYLKSRTIDNMNVLYLKRTYPNKGRFSFTKHKSSLIKHSASVTRYVTLRHASCQIVVA